MTGALPPPDLEDRFHAPSGWQWGRFTNAAGRSLRYGWAAPEGARAVAVVVGGFREFAEKYFEMMRDLMARDFAVWFLDWRGQGGSERYYPQPHRPGAAGYDQDVADLHQLITGIIRAEARLPRVLFCHSMGGHIGLRYLHDHPGTFACAVMTAPMFEINYHGMPRGLARLIAESGSLFGRGGRYIPTGKDWAWDDSFTVEQSLLTQDPVRYLVADRWMRHQGELALGDATVSWLANAMRSIALINRRSYLRAIRTPVLIASPQADEVVDARAHARAAQHLPAATLYPVPGAKHELWMEKDEYRQPWLAEMDRFLARHIGV